jgi:hypothetical protein
LFLKYTFYISGRLRNYIAGGKLLGSCCPRIRDKIAAILGAKMNKKEIGIMRGLTVIMALIGPYFLAQPCYAQGNSFCEGFLRAVTEQTW